MSKQNTGGPAFPSSITHDSFHVEGMTLRDYFAAKAMAALVVALDDDPGLREDSAYQAVSRMAYDMADAMLAAREPT